MIDLFCSGALVLAIAVAAGAYARRLATLGPARHARIDRAGSSVLLGKGLLEMGYWAMRPAARACVALGIGADAVSWASLALAAAAGVALASGWFGVGAALSAGSALCDGLDGMIARETGTANDAGEVLDAAIDRYAELFFLGGIAVHERERAGTLLLALAATAGAIMVSYATAKAEAMRASVPRGIMRRQERAVYLALGAALVPVAAAVAQRSGWPLPPWTARAPLLLALGLVAVLGNASAVLRLRAIAKAVRRAQPADAPPRRTDAEHREASVHAAAGHAPVR